MSAEKDMHRPLAVLSVEGIPFVDCSCGDDVKPSVHRWHEDHWPGDDDSGAAALKAVVDRQKRQSETPILPPIPPEGGESA